MIGFCMGGRVAYLMAAVNPSFKASVVYCGGYLFAARGDGPSPFEKTPQIHCPILGHFGQGDVNPSPDDMRKLDAELTKHVHAHKFRYIFSGPKTGNFLFTPQGVDHGSGRGYTKKERNRPPDPYDIGDVISAYTGNPPKGTPAAQRLARPYDA